MKKFKGTFKFALGVVVSLVVVVGATSCTKKDGTTNDNKKTSGKIAVVNALESDFKVSLTEDNSGVVINMKRNSKNQHIL